MRYYDRMIEAVGNLPFDGEPIDEAVDGAFAILAAMLAMLPARRREACLAEIERGDLREAAGRFERIPPHTRWCQ
jgi:hypothetical protein